MEQNPFGNIKMKHPIFKGKKDQSFRQFLAKYQKWIEFQNLQPQHEMMALGICLENDAEEAFDSIRREQPNANIEEIKELLKLRYDEDDDSIGIRNKMGKRKLKNGETVNEYYNEIKTWADKINLDDETLKYELINGLPRYMIEHIISGETDSSIDVIKQARRLEQARSFSNNNEYDAKTEAIKEAKIAATSYPQNNNREMNEIKEGVKAITEAVKYLMKERKEEQGKEKKRSDYGNNYYKSDNNDHGPLNPEVRPFRPNNQVNSYNHDMDPFDSSWRDDQHHEKGYTNRVSVYPNQNEMGEAIKCNINATLAKRTENEELGHSMQMSKDFTIEGMVADNKMKMLIDSGAICSLINQEVIDGATKQWKIRKSEYDKIVSVSLNETRINGMIEEQLKIGSLETSVKLHILPNISYPIILGRDWIAQYVKSIDFDTREIEFRDEEGKVFTADINSINEQEELALIQTADVEENKTDHKVNTLGRESNTRLSTKSDTTVIEGMKKGIDNLKKKLRVKEEELSRVRIDLATEENRTRRTSNKVSASVALNDMQKGIGALKIKLKAERKKNRKLEEMVNQRETVQPNSNPDRNKQISDPQFELARTGDEIPSIDKVEIEANTDSASVNKITFVIIKWVIWIMAILTLIMESTRSKIRPKIENGGYCQKTMHETGACPNREQPLDGFQTNETETVEVNWQEGQKRTERTNEETHQWNGTSRKRSKVKINIKGGIKVIEYIYIISIIFISPFI